jgi:hypothetical protein
MIAKISEFWKCIQGCLPGFEEELGIITSKHTEIMYVLDEVRIEDYIDDPGFCSGRGRPKTPRTPLARAFIAKSVLNLELTNGLIERIHADPTLRRICGWNSRAEIPCESTFSNAFSEFARDEIFQNVHEEMVVEIHENVPIHHVSRDSTEISSREKPKRKREENEKPKKFKRGRPRKGEKRPEKEPKRLEKQKGQTLAEMLNELPKECAKGNKKNAKGYSVSWNGYKLHADVVDGGIAVACILTSASVHDSQVSLPLEEMTSHRVSSLYTLADAAYDAEIIHQHMSGKGKVAIIDDNPRKGDKKEKTPPQKERYKNRTAVERFFGALKDNFGCARIRVRGHRKVFAQLMLGVLCHTSLRVALE